MKLQDLADKHNYYCNDSNYSDGSEGETWETMTAFLDEYETEDVDMNLCFRWDVNEETDWDDIKLGKYSAMVHLIHQRKGRFVPHSITTIVEPEVDRFVAYITKHSETILNIWQPIIK